MLSKYPQCRDIDDLVTQQDGTVMFLRSWLFVLEVDGSVKAMDNAGRRIQVFGVPSNIKLIIGGAPGTATIPGLWCMDLHVKVYYVVDQMWGSMRNDVEIHYHEVKSADCECGSKFDSYGAHSYWCPAREND